MTATTTIEPPGGGLAWYALSARDVTAQMGVDADAGLTVAEVHRRQAEYGPNELPTEPPPSTWAVAREQLANPMNIMLLIVVATGLPTFVQAMLSSGARRLAESKAVVKSLSDVETLGGTTVINSDKTGTLTMNAMTATTMLAGGDWFKIEGPGYQKAGAILGVAGEKPPDFHRLALGLVLCTDATVGDDGSVIGDPTEAAFVVLAAKMGVDAEQTREALPRLAEVPFDSAYKYMATFHDLPGRMGGLVIRQPHFTSVKGAPDVVLQHCGYALWHGEVVPVATVREEILAANRQLSERGLRVLAFAARDLDDAAMAAALADPMAAVTDLVMVALVGIMDPPRAEAKDAVRTALGAGVDVRMITGDHTVTARAIADELGLGPGVITGTNCST
jgi:Ca2+-transporting ATPase